ncbi:hypothetical protein C4D60_Mb10t24520 [Musa balbisiana]|uniref:Uncharacterized protein n=1 Tax=Musa balbisiana TaxID=52838 RepID=A0A4S8J0Z3_MUSBA|nr:hypothetical protein C4D60_Mb10t24520 [Musa balbisiana]
MDHYDDEDDGIELFSTGLGDVCYPSNVMDPYLRNKDNDDDDDDEIEDMTIKPTDAVIVCARNEDEVSHLEARNFIAVGSMEPAIEIWDLDLIDEVQPFLVLGGVSKKKNKEKKLVQVPTKQSSTGKCAVTVAHHRDKMDMRTSTQVSLENGTVQGFDVRASSDSGSSSKPTFILHAHDKAASAVSFNRAAPNSNKLNHVMNKYGLSAKP